LAQYTAGVIASLSGLKKTQNILLLSERDVFLPAPGITTPSLTYTYAINDSCFHPLLFLFPYLPEILSVLE